MPKLTHFNQNGEAHMGDVGAKAETQRVAIVTGVIRMHAETLSMIMEGGHKKGDVLGIARVAGIMAAKRTSDLIPLCHPLMLTHIEVTFKADSETSELNCEARVESKGQTGVEMEALMAVQVALLTIYDMCKAADRGMVISDVHLKHKSGGKSGTYDVASE